MKIAISSVRFDNLWVPPMIMCVNEIELRLVTLAALQDTMRVTEALREAVNILWYRHHDGEAIREIEEILNGEEN